MTPEALKQILLEKALTDSVERASFIHGFRTAEKIYTQEVNMELKVKKLHGKAILPTYGTAGAACFDLYALDDGSQQYGGLPIQFREACTFRTGLSFEIPDGYVMHVYSRSGHGFKNGVRWANSVGVVDSDYVGEVMVCLANDGKIGLKLSMVTELHKPCLSRSIKCRSLKCKN